VTKFYKSIKLNLLVVCSVVEGGFVVEGGGVVVAPTVLT
jgi:hypothetical protein